jgi:hypothetical protein
MTIRKMTVVMIILAAVSGTAFADTSVGDARWLHEKWCGIRSTDTCNPRDLTMFNGFVIAVAQMAENEMPFAIRIPFGTTFGQLFEVVGRYLDSHPEDWSADADTVVVKALKVAFPARK